MAEIRERILIGARNLPGLGHLFAVLAHRKPGARLEHAGHDRLEVPRTQTEERLDAPPGAASTKRAQQQLLVLARIDDGRIADRVEPAGDAGVHLAERDFHRHGNRGVESGAAGALHVDAGSLRIEAGRQHALAHQVEVLGVLEHGAAGDIAEALAREAVFGDQRLQYRGVHVLVADARIGAVAARERNAHAADHGDATNIGSDQHGQLLRMRPLGCHAHREFNYRRGHR